MTIFKIIREKTKLTKGDVQRLLGLKCWGSLSRIEQGKRLVTKEIAIGYHVLFGLPFEEIFKQEINQTQKYALSEAPALFDNLKGANNTIDQVERLLSLQKLQEHETS